MAPMRPSYHTRTLTAALLLLAPIACSAVTVPKSAKRVNVYGVGKFIDGYGMEVPGVGTVMCDPVLATLEENAHKWIKYDEVRLATRNGRSEAAEAAAAKLIGNHDRVLKDVTNPLPRSQPQLRRVSLLDTSYVDEALREISRILLGKPSALDAPPEPLGEQQARAWLQTCAFLDLRLQSSRVESPGREPDMSVEAAMAMRAALAEVAQLASSAIAATNAPPQAEPAAPDEPAAPEEPAAPDELMGAAAPAQA